MIAVQVFGIILCKMEMRATVIAQVMLHQNVGIGAIAGRAGRWLAVVRLCFD